MPRFPANVDRDGAAFVTLTARTRDVEVVGAVHNVRRDYDAEPLSAADVVGVGDVDGVVGVAVGVVGDEAHWCFIGEEGGVVDVRDIVVYCFVVDLLSVDD